MQVSASKWLFVANIVFQGPAALTLDGKGRIAMPSRHRELLTAMDCNQLTITKNPAGCLLVFPRPAWQNFLEKVTALPMEAAGWKRLFLGNAMDVEIDASSGRVLVAPELRSYAGLARDVMLLGMGNHLELWDAGRYAAHEAQMLAEQQMPESLKSFTF